MIAVEASRLSALKGWEQKLPPFSFAASCNAPSRGGHGKGRGLFLPDQTVEEISVSKRGILPILCLSILCLLIPFASRALASQEAPLAAELRDRVEAFFATILGHRMRTFYVYERTAPFFVSREDHEDFLALFLESLDRHRFPESRVVAYEIEKIEILEEEDLEPRAVVSVLLEGRKIWNFLERKASERLIWFREGEVWYLLPPRPATLKAYGLSPSSS